MPKIREGVTIEIVNEGPVYYGVKDFRNQRIRIANVNMPLSDIDGEKVGVIVNIGISAGHIKFEAMIKDTPKMRKALGIGSLGVGISNAEARRPERRKRS